MRGKDVNSGTIPWPHSSALLYSRRSAGHPKINVRASVRNS